MQAGSEGSQLDYDVSRKGNSMADSVSEEQQRNSAPCAKELLLITMQDESFLEQMKLAIQSSKTHFVQARDPQI